MAAVRPRKYAQTEARAYMTVGAQSDQTMLHVWGLRGLWSCSAGSGLSGSTHGEAVKPCLPATAIWQLSRSCSLR